MHLANFESEVDYEDFYTVPLKFGAQWIYIGATYDNGDGTDRWCRNFQTIPKNIVRNNYKDTYEFCNLGANMIVVDGNKALNLLIPPTFATAVQHFICEDF